MRKTAFIAPSFKAVIDNWTREFGRWMVIPYEPMIPIKNLFERKGFRVVEMSKFQTKANYEDYDIIMGYIHNIPSEVDWSLFNGIVTQDSIQQKVKRNLPEGVSLSIISKNKDKITDDFDIVEMMESESDIVELTCLGAGGFYTTDNIHTMCWMVPQLGVIFDAGSGFYRAFETLLTDTVHIFLSHGHLDHLDGIRLASRLSKNVHIHAEPDVLRGIELLHSPPFSKPGTLTGVELCPITDTNPIQLENGTVITPFHVSHTCSCLGYRLDYKSHSMSYITDTYIPDHCEYIDIVKDVNLLVHECYYQNSMQMRAKSAGHSTSESVSKFAASARAKKLIISHLNPNGNHDVVLNEIQKEIPSAELAQERKSYQF